MSSMAFAMYQFTKGEGRLNTTQDLFTQAEYFAEEANRLYKIIRQFSYQVLTYIKQSRVRSRPIVIIKTCENCDNHFKFTYKQFIWNKKRKEVFRYCYHGRTEAGVEEGSCPSPGNCMFYNILCLVYILISD